MPLPWITLLDFLCTIAFALSGVLVALRGQMDVIGSVILAIITAIGGGTLRDLLLNANPVFWVATPAPLYWAATTGCLGYYICHDNHLDELWLKVLDAIGLAYFSIFGMERALDFGAPAGVAMLLGTGTAVFGGLIRDTLANQVPFIFRGELYASSALAGVFAYWLFLQINPENQDFYLVCSALIIFALRIGAILYKWELPLSFKDKTKT